MRLIAIDMDGTLLNDRKTVSKENIRALKDATAQGHIIMLCSGRSSEDVLSFQKEHSLSLPFASCNGTVVYADDKVVHRTPINLKAAAEAYQYLEEEDLPFQFYTNHGVFTNGKFYRKSARAFLSAPKAKLAPIPFRYLFSYRKKVGSTKIKSFDEMRHIEGLEIYKFFIYTPCEKRKQALLTTINKIEGLNTTSSSSDNVEITAINGHKGNGVMEMAKYYGIPIEDTVAIGDNLNDLPMLQVAGLSIAMANGEDKVKELCDVTTLTNEENGVAYAIHKYILDEGLPKKNHA